MKINNSEKGLGITGMIGISVYDPDVHKEIKNKICKKCGYKLWQHCFIDRHNEPICSGVVEEEE